MFPKELYRIGEVLKFLHTRNGTRALRRPLKHLRADGHRTLSLTMHHLWDSLCPNFKCSYLIHMVSKKYETTCGIVVRSFQGVCSELSHTEVVQCLSLVTELLELL